MFSYVFGAPQQKKSYWGKEGILLGGTSHWGEFLSVLGIDLGMLSLLGGILSAFGTDFGVMFILLGGVLTGGSG